MSRPKLESFLSEDESLQVMLQLAHGQGCFSEDEAVLAVRWANEMRIGAAALDGVLRGRFFLTVEGGKVKFMAQPLPDAAARRHRSEQGGERELAGVGASCDLLDLDDEVPF